MERIVAAAISDIEEAAILLHKRLSNVQNVDLAQISEVNQQYTVRESLAHLIGWQGHALEILPDMLAHIDNSTPPVDAETIKAQAFSRRKNNSVDELLAEFDEKNQQLINILRTASPEALTLRRVRNNQIFTVKSYVIDTVLQNVLGFVDQLKDL